MDIHFGLWFSIWISLWIALLVHVSIMSATSWCLAHGEKWRFLFTLFDFLSMIERDKDAKTPSCYIMASDFSSGFGVFIHWHRDSTGVWERRYRDNRQEIKQSNLSELHLLLEMMDKPNFDWTIR